MFDLLTRFIFLAQRINFCLPRARVILLAATATVIVGCNNKDTELADVKDHVGKATYERFCKVCHAQGLNGAPILGNAAMWGSRVTQGEEKLVENAINGVGLMPANRGRNEALTEEKIAQVVAYMLSELN